MSGSVERLPHYLTARLTRYFAEMGDPYVTVLPLRCCPLATSTLPQQPPETRSTATRGLSPAGRRLSVAVPPGLQSFAVRVASRSAKVTTGQ